MVDMARYEQQPENALKRANEFMEIGKPVRALDTLQEVFKNKQWTYNWSESVLEPIMFKYLSLCVELKKSHIAKEGLFQYRNMCQSVNVETLENVTREYLRMAEEKAENARKQSAQAVIDSNNLAAESILLRTVSGENSQDRSDRTILTPWVKFLWESYCQCLDLLRTNAHVERLYHDIARMAFQFCCNYNKKTEFRKLCDKLRKHLEDICKLPARLANVSISKLETQQLHLETRLEQLDFSIQLELWQEAYKAIQDINNLIKLSKKPPLPKTMANYYQKLSVLFWKAGNGLFHAAALLKLLQLSMETKKYITSEELQKLACRSVLAILSIPLLSAHPDNFIETDKCPLEKAQRLANLLSLTKPPTRSSLLKDLVRLNLMKLATPQLQELYRCLEVDFDPLILSSRVHNFIQYIWSDNIALQQYVVALQDVTLVRLIGQVAQVYQSIEFSRLLEIAKFATPFYLERLLVDCVRYNDMQIRIDHISQCIHFGIDSSGNLREEISLQSEQVRNQLIDMSSVLNKAVHIISANQKWVEHERIRAILVQNYLENMAEEHQKILQRYKIIEDRKEYIEKLNREEKEQKRVKEILHQQMLAEKICLAEAKQEGEKRRQQREIEQIKNKNLQHISQTEHCQKILKKIDGKFLKKQCDLQAKLKSQEKKLDYYERAKRLEEIPLWRKYLEDWQIQYQTVWEQQEKERIAFAIAQYKLAICTKDRLIRMKADKEQFLTMLKEQRSKAYEGKFHRFETLITQERGWRLADRQIKRKLNRRAKWLEEKQEEEKLKRQEKNRLEDQKRLALEEIEKQKQLNRQKVEKEKKERECRENNEMRERAGAKQRAREEEIERKLQKEKEVGDWRTMGAPRDNKNDSKKDEPWIPKHHTYTDSQRQYRQRSNFGRSEKGSNDESRGFARLGHKTGNENDKERGDFRFFSK